MSTKLSPDTRAVIERARATAEAFYKDPFAESSLSTIEQSLSDIESAMGKHPEILESVKSTRVTLELVYESMRDGRMQDALNGAVEAGCRWMALLRKVAWPRGNGRPARDYESVVLEVMAEGRIKHRKDVANEVYRRVKKRSPYIQLTPKTILNQIPKILAKSNR